MREGLAEEVIYELAFGVGRGRESFSLRGQDVEGDSVLGH